MPSSADLLASFLSRLKGDLWDSGGKTNLIAEGHKSVTKQIPKSKRKKGKATLQNAPGVADVVHILCLHGFTQNATLFEKRVQSVCRVLKPAKLHFAESNIRARADLCNQTRSREGQMAWFNPCEASHRPVQSKQYEGWEKSLTLLQGVVAEIQKSAPSKIGVLAFSQGCCMASILMASLPPSTFSFAIFSGGFAPQDAATRKIVSDALPLCIPSLHFSGTADPLVSFEDSFLFSSMFSQNDCKMLIHEKGHIVPPNSFKPQVKEFFHKYALGVSTPN